MRVLNTAFLSIVGFVPFLSSLMSEYGHHKIRDQQIATQLSASFVLAAGLLQVGMWAYGCRASGGRQVSEAVQTDHFLRTAIYLKSAVLPSAMLCVVLLANISTSVSSVSRDLFTVLAVVGTVATSFLHPASRYTFPSADDEDADGDAGADADADDHWTQRLYSFLRRQPRRSTLSQPRPSARAAGGGQAGAGAAGGGDSDDDDDELLLVVSQVSHPNVDQR